MLGTIISMIFASKPCRCDIAAGQRIPQTIAPTEHFVVYFRIALIGGVIIAMPMIVYRWCALLPGLPHERKYLTIYCPAPPQLRRRGVRRADHAPTAINLCRFLSDVVEMADATTMSPL